MPFFDNTNHVILIGILIHILLLITVFDTYFKSPLENNLNPIKSTNNPPAKRLVIFIADGLRAQSLFNEELNTPFLKSLKERRSSWGVSYTRVPTESRPGHVAILAGIYEDPSAIFKGWKHNPVKFDSVINQSNLAYGWGSPDIVPLFYNGEKHIHINCYDSELQDFGSKDTSILDNWVFDLTEKFLVSLEKKSSKMVDKSGVVFFLHLLGTDTAGHAFKPYSAEYINNIEVLDRGIERMESIFNQVFTDKRTSYIFTSDHGMTDWGSHGSGLDVETHTPIIAWGAGIKVDQKRKDIRQIDLAPLLSSLIGINFPSNSLGKIPLRYLNANSYDLKQLYLMNILQIFEIFDTKRLKISKTTFFYKSFPDLSSTYFEREWNDLLKNNESNAAILIRCNELFQLVLKGIDYYNHYFTSNILLSVSIGLGLWMFYLSTFLIEENVKYDKNLRFIEISLYVYVLFVFLLCFFQSQPLFYYLYFSFPCLSLYLLLQKYNKVLNLLYLLQQFTMSNLLESFSYITCTILFIYGFYQRYLFSVVTILISFSFFISLEKKKYTNLELYSWLTSSVILAIFPLMPLMNTVFQLSWIVLGFILWQLISLIGIRIVQSKYKYSKKSIKILKLQLVFSWFAFSLAILTAYDIIDNSSKLKYFSILVSLVPLIFVPFTERYAPLRLFSIFQSLIPYYIMTSTSYELLFLNVYIINLILWLRLETKGLDFFNFKFGEESFTMKGLCLRICFTFVSFILLGFFGTGNVASLNSFDPMWVRCFLTVFSPFKMTSLIIVKLSIPFIISACVFRTIVTLSGISLMKTFCTILIISDCMVFFFMYRIKNVGSWLDIGMSLSHFIIVEIFSIVIILLYTVAYFLTNIHYIQFKIKI